MSCNIQKELVTNRGYEITSLVFSVIEEELTEFDRISRRY